jgi:transcriptional regulator with XRE-family HTH domain
MRETRLALGWSQQKLADRSGISRQMVGLVESGEANVTIAVAAALCDALGLRVDLGLHAPFLADRRRQREPAHGSCSAYFQRRLVSFEWLVRREVEISHGRSHGWIDLLAYDPRTRRLLVIEVKTEIEDLGKIERTLAWYERESWALARGFGWRPVGATRVLALLATDANDRRLIDNRDVVRASFPIAADALHEVIVDGRLAPAGSALALIDPRRRRRDWLIRPRVDGRRSAAPYADYADFIRTIRHAAYGVTRPGDATVTGRLVNER